MKRKLLPFLVVAGLWLGACGTPVPSPEAEVPSTPQPQVVGEWVGVGVKTTEPFTIDSEPWVIEWTNLPVIINNRSIGMLQIMVYKTESPSVPVAVVVNSAAKESDTSYIHETGTFYLMINATNTRWSVKVLATQ